MKKIKILSVVLISMFFVNNVNAAQVEGCIDSGTSLKNYAKLGYNYVGATGKYYSIAAGALDNNQLNVEFCTDINESTEQSGTATVGFSIDFCTNLSIKDNNIVFSPKNGNYIDYLGWAGYNVYLTSADWSAATCYRAFVRLKMNYYNNVGTSVSTMFTQYSDTDSDFQFTNKDSWSGMLSFYDIIYYNEDDYNKALLSFKGDNASVETNDKLDNVQGAIGETNDKLDDVTGAIGDTNDKLDDTNDKLGDLNDSLTDSTIDDSSAGGFFSNFDSEDNGGISGIITAPLRFIQNLTGTCQPYSIPVYDTNVELPCGTTIFWDKPEVQDFRNIWNIIVGGPIVYALLLKLLKVINNLKDPDNSKLEVIDL